jgi:hypothetical protein
MSRIDLVIRTQALNRGRPKAAELERPGAHQLRHVAPELRQTERPVLVGVAESSEAPLADRKLVLGCERGRSLASRCVVYESRIFCQLSSEIGTHLALDLFCFGVLKRSSGRGKSCVRHLASC